MSHILSPIPQNHLLGLTGPSGSGKDLAGSMLTMLGYTRFSLGDLIREDIIDSIDLVKAGLAISPLTSLKVTDQSIRQAYYRVFNSKKSLYIKPTPKHFRKLLQWWGTEYRRKQDKDFWIKQLEKVIHLPGGIPYPIVITDIRFPNEADWLMSKSWKPFNVFPDLWRINRPMPKSKLMKHSSESHFKNLPITGTIHNTGDHYELARQIKEKLS